MWWPGLYGQGWRVLLAQCSSEQLCFTLVNCMNECKLQPQCYFRVGALDLRRLGLRSGLLGKTCTTAVPRKVSKECVCVCEREREREKETEAWRSFLTSSAYKSSFQNILVPKTIRELKLSTVAFTQNVSPKDKEIF